MGWVDKRIIFAAGMRVGRHHCLRAGAAAAGARGHGHSQAGSGGQG